MLSIGKVAEPYMFQQKGTCGRVDGTKHRGHYMIDVSDYDGRRNKRGLWIINSRRNKRGATLTSLSALLCFCSRDVQSHIYKSNYTVGCLNLVPQKQFE